MELVDDIQKLFVKNRAQSRPFPKRPDTLTIGTPLQLLTNHFLLRVGNKCAFHYDIEIERFFKTSEDDNNVVDKPVEETVLSEKKRNQYSRKMATKLNRKVFQRMVDLYSRTQIDVFTGINPVFDGQKNMFTSKILRGTEDNAILRLKVVMGDEGYGRESTFYVNIKSAETNCVIDLDVLNRYHSGKTCDYESVKKSVLFINTLLKNNTTMDYIPIGQSFFQPTRGQPDPRNKLTQLLYLSFGFYSSVRNLMVGPTLNIDQSATAFYDTNENIIESIINGKLERIPKLEDNQRRKIAKELTGLQVEATHIRYGNYLRKYRILGITRTSADEITFEWTEKKRDGTIESKGTVSVTEYFQKKYNYTLKCPQLPCYELGNPKNRVMLPLEVCRLVANQRPRRSLTNSERSKMTRISGQKSPKERLESCRGFVSSQFHSGRMADKNRPFLSEFGIDVSRELLIVGSKVIPPPLLKYSNNSSVKPIKGEWDMFTNKSKFLKSERLDNWIVINMSFTESFGDEEIKQFIGDLIETAKRMGMACNEPKTKARISNYSNSTFNGIKGKLKAFPTTLQMILFFIPDKGHEYGDEIYSEVKLLGDVEKGLTTQCVNINSIWNSRERIKKWNPSYLKQLMLKVNPKLGGTNLALPDDSVVPTSFKGQAVMIVGADVNHPAPADKISPSIVALVGSYDKCFSNYYTTVSMQPKSREEMIKNLDQMTIELLDYYKKKNSGKLPQRIIFYRDGVSEGQFQQVIDSEYSLLTKAFSAVNPTYKPKLTFIVVQKRHNTRFMTADTKQNVPAGTVVEKDVTHKTDFDFYLCSHTGRLGTSRSAHYYVLADENGFSSDDMCKMTYYLCHIYQRCTKSVSIPAPVYYADLAAYRAKVHASVHTDNSSDNSSSISGESPDRQVVAYEDKIKVKDSQKHKLYFC